MGQILLAGEEPHERPPLAGARIAKGATQDGVLQLDRVEHRTLGGHRLDLHLAVAVGELAQLGRQQDPDHDSVCTSTDSTAGRSRTIGRQLSPESAET